MISAVRTAKVPVIGHRVVPPRNFLASTPDASSRSLVLPLTAGAWTTAPALRYQPSLFSLPSRCRDLAGPEIDSVALAGIVLLTA